LTKRRPSPDADALDQGGDDRRAPPGSARLRRAATELMTNAAGLRDHTSRARRLGRWIWGLALVLGQLWSLLALGAVSFRLDQSGSAASRPVLFLTAAGAALVLLGWVLFATARRRAAGLLWIAFAVAGAGLVAAIGRSGRAEVALALFGAMALSGLLALAAGSPRGAKPVLAAALAFGLVVAWGAGRDRADGRLWRAVRSRDLPAVKSLLAGGAEVDREGPAGVTPLMVAVAAGDAEMVRVLVEGGASAYTRDARGRSAMMRALERQDDALAVALLLTERQRLDRGTLPRGGAR
jgi:hypothetical protein